MKNANLTNLWIQGLLMAAVVAVALPMPELAFAQTGNGLSGAAAASQQNVFNPLLQALSFGSYTVGGFLGIAGIMKLRAHSENPTSVPLTHGIGRLSAAAGFLALPSVMAVLNNTSTQTLGGTAQFNQFGIGIN